MEKRKLAAGKLKYAKTMLEFLTPCIVNDTVLEKMDSKEELISSENGVFDLKQNEFRKRQIDDYITFTLNCDYTNNYNNDIYNEIIIMFKHISNDDVNLFDLVMKWYDYNITEN